MVLHSSKKISFDINTATMFQIEKKKKEVPSLIYEVIS